MDVIGIGTLVGAGALGGLTFAVAGYWKAHKEEALDVKKMLPTLAIGVLFGIGGALMLPSLTETSISLAYTAGLGGSATIQKIIGGL